MSEYEKQNFQPHTVLTAAKLNAMDNQVYDDSVSIDGLKEDLSEFRSELFDGITVSEDTYISRTTGRVETLSLYFATGYIPLTYHISVRTKVGNDTSGIAFYSSDKTFISGYNPYDDNETEVLLNPPEGAAYVRVSCLDAYRSKFICRYNKALSTIESKILTLNDNISSTNARIDDMSKVDYDIITASYVSKSNGSQYSDVAAYFSTDFIEVSDGIIVKTKVQDDSAGICFYTQGRTFISGYNPYSDNETEVILQPPEGAAYVRISCLTNYADNFVCRYDNALIPVYTRIDTLDTEVAAISEQLAKVNDTDYEAVEASYIHYSNGQRETGVSVYFSTDYIALSGYTVYVRTKVADDLSGIAFYDANKSFISGYNPYDDNETETMLEPPEGAVYVRISCLTSYADYFVCRYDNVLESIKNDVLEINAFIASHTDDFSHSFWAQAMWKVLCIGDSLTSGANYNEEWGEQTSPGASIDQNYPRMLGRLICGETTNAGFSGYSASTWWNSKKDSYQFNDYDTFIIWLGTNNGLTDTLDTDVDPYDDYSDFAETETGYYCRIIEKIKEENESCLIVLTKIFASRDDVETTNSVIDKIAQKYGLPVIDNSDLGASAHPELHGGISNPHFGKAGNAFIANRYVNELGKWFDENPLRCEYHYTSRTN